MMLAQGFAVVRVRTQNWWEVKGEHPEWFAQNVLKELETEQQLICTLNFIYAVAPLVAKVHELLGDLAGLVNWQDWSRNYGIEIYLPEGVSQVSRDMYLITEASSCIGKYVTPTALRKIYWYYDEPVLWCGFNSETKSTGSKGVLATAEGLETTKGMLERIRIWHIDQTYKSMVGSFFGVVDRNHISLGVLEHRSQCCDGTRGGRQAMSSWRYRPKPDVPDSHHRIKESVGVEAALRSALRNTQLVKGGHGHTDLVCLRLRTYLRDDDPLLQDAGVVQFLDEVAAKADDKFAASACCRLERFLNVNDELNNKLDVAMGVLQAREAATDASRQTLEWCRHKNWFSDTYIEKHFEAMISRGLTKHSTEECLTCVHHNRQLWGAAQCWEHFTRVANWHRNELPSLSDVVDRLRDDGGGSLDTVGEDAADILKRFYTTGVHAMRKLGWQSGALSNKGGALGLVTPLPMASSSSQPEIFMTQAITQSLSGTTPMKKRLKVDANGALVRIAFTKGEVLLNSSTALRTLSWDDVVTTLASCTQVALHQHCDPSVVALDQCNLMTELACLPKKLQTGLLDANNFEIWKQSASTVLDGLGAWRDYSRNALLKDVGKLWKTMEVAMNHAALDLPFCIFVSSKIAHEVSERDLGGMAFGLVWDGGTDAFRAKVRYKAQGRIASRRYKKTGCTSRQAVLGHLERCIDAAKGVNPVMKAKVKPTPSVVPPRASRDSIA